MNKKLEAVREKYGPAVAAWCEAKIREEGEMPSEERIAQRIRPSDRPPPPWPDDPREGSQ